MYPRRLTFSVLLAIPMLLAAAPAAPAAPEVAELDLIGSWFVVIHYTDSATANPDADRWEDKVWKIEKKGSRLQWTEYPIVVFNDGSGRFGRVGRNPRARLLTKWEPNTAQTEEIEQGLQVNSRGSKKKTLRGTSQKGYKSSSQSRSMSAMTVGYQETWSIDDPTTLPVFTRDDALGTESALATKSDKVVSGRTRYATLRASDDGNVLTGTYFRDENKKGTFKLIRSGAARGIESDGRTPNQKAQDRIRERIRSGTRDIAYTEFLKALGDDNVRALRGQLGEEKLSGVWQKYEQRIIAGDESARKQVGDELRATYIASVKEDLAKSLADGDPDVWLAAEQKGASPEKLELMRKVLDGLGEQKIAALRAKYGDRVRAGDADATAAMREEIRSAYEASLKADFLKRIDSGDASAIQELREMQRKERDRRD